MLSQDIEALHLPLSKAREETLFRKAEYENQYSQAILLYKLKDQDATQTDLKANAVQASFAARLEMIRAESTYHALQNSMKAKTDALEALREVSFNLRKEASIQ